MSIRSLIFTHLLRDTLYFRVAVLSSSSSNSEYRERERKKEDVVENNAGVLPELCSLPFPFLLPVYSRLHVNRFLPFRHSSTLTNHPHPPPLSLSSSIGLLHSIGLTTPLDSHESTGKRGGREGDMHPSGPSPPSLSLSSLLDSHCLSISHFDLSYGTAPLSFRSGW